MVNETETPSLETGKQSRNEFRRISRIIIGRPLAAMGTVVILIFILAAIFAPLAAPYEPNAQNLNNILRAPSSEHFLGTDALGRDVFSRIIFGSQTAIMVGVVALGMAAVSGIILGVTAGYFGGYLGAIIMRMVDALMAFPFILLALAISALLGGGLFNVMVALGIGMMPIFARMMYGQTVSIKEHDYVLAERSLGSNSLRIIFRHIVPNAFPPLIVLLTMTIGWTILAEAALSYLSIGIKAPTPAWGSMVSDGYTYLLQRPLLSVAPGFAIMIVVFGFNMFGDGLRDAIDPRLRGIL